MSGGAFCLAVGLLLRLSLRVLVVLIWILMGSGIFGLSEVMVYGEGLFYGCFSIDLLGGGVFIVYGGGGG